MLSKGARDMIAWCAAGCPLPGEAARADFGHSLDDEADGSFADDCIGALVHPESRAAYLPWNARPASADVRRMLDELRVMIGELATLECWPLERHNEILSRAMRGPLADLMPNFWYFSRRIAEKHAEAAAHEILAARTWRGEGLDDRRP